MKKIVLSFFLLILTLFSVQTQADNVGAVNAVYSSPAAFRADQQVTFYFDLTGTGLVGMANLHLYSWTPKEIEPWGNPSANTLLTMDPNNSALYTLTCIPTDLWGTTIDLFGYKIEGLIKTEDGTKQTDDFKEANGNAFALYNFDALNAKIADVWPPNFTYEKPISIIVNLATAWSNAGASQGQLIGENVYIWLGANAWTPGSNFNALGNPGAKCNDVAGLTNISKYDFWPSETFPAPAFVIKEIDFLFNNGTWDKTGRDVGGADFIVKAQTGSVAMGAFVPFPIKATDQDLITITYNASLDTTGSGASQGILTGSDRVFVFMEMETESGNVVPIDLSVVPQTSKLMMKTMPDGTYQFSFLLNELYTDTELPAGLVIKKIYYKFVNYDGLVSPYGTMDPKLYKIDVYKAD